MSGDEEPGPQWAPTLEALHNVVATIAGDGRLLYLNRTISGRPVADVIGMNSLDFGAPEERPIIAKILEAVMRGETRYHETNLSGTNRWVTSRYEPYWRDGRIAAVQVTALESTERHKAGEALRAQEDLAKALLRAIPDMIFRVDRQHRFLDYSGADQKTYRPPSEFLGKKMEDILPAPVCAILTATLERALALGSSERAEYTLEKEGAVLSYEARIVAYAPDEALAIVRDVTDLAQAQSALASSEANLRRMIDQLPDAVLIHRRREVLFVNNAGVRILGYESPGEVIGRDVIDFVHPDDREQVLARMQQMLLTGQPAPASEERFVRKDGGQVTLELAPVQFVDIEGGRASLVLARDVTERQKMQERFLLADRVASMGNLAAGLVHEINNPLTYVIGNLTVATRVLTEVASAIADPRLLELLRAVADARAGAERVRYIVADLRAFSAPDRGEIGSVDLRKVLDSAINIAWSEIRHRARLVREYSDTPNVIGSESRLGQVFLNLLLNAAQSIESEGDASRNRIHVATRADAEGRAHVEIRDTGRGFTPEVAARMWDPFYTTKPPGEGTGLGLSICQSIVTSVGGEISARHDPKDGTVFRVVLPPFVGDVVAQVATPAKPVEDAPALRGRLLVVDDEPVIAAMVRRALSEHDVYLVTSGRDALELCRELSFDLIIVDLLMPDLTGMDLYEAIRLFQPGLEERLVFMTAGAFTARARDFLSRVPNTVIEKPFDLEDLEAIVKDRLRAKKTLPAV